MSEKLLLIDASAIIYRAWYAFPQDMKTSGGIETNAVFGFSLMVLNLLEREKPDYIALAFEGGGPSHRKARFPEYKATRPGMPPELQGQLTLIETVAEVLGIPIYRKLGFEADDVIGTLAAQAAARKLDTLICTGDKDLLQLIRPGVRVVTPGKSFSEAVYWDGAAFKEKYGFDSYFFGSYKAFVGDKSDNIPGIPQIGPKAATTLVNTYGTASNILFHLSAVQPERIHDIIFENFKQLERNIELVKIVTDLTGVALDLEACRAGQFWPSETIKLFRELEFTRLYGHLNRLFTDKKTAERGPLWTATEEAKQKPAAAQKKDEFILFPVSQETGQPVTTNRGQLVMF